METKQIMKMVDHTNLKQGALVSDFEKLCKEAIEYGFKSVCVHPSQIKLCRELLKGSDVLVCTVIGFPLGENTTEVKAFEAKNAEENGAQEIDMVISNSMAKRGEFDKITEEINAVVASAPSCTHKVIIETCLLTQEEIEKVTNAVVLSDADFVKTSTGFCGQGATVANVAIMKSVTGDKKLIKAAGGVAGAKDAIAMIEAGASRLGTSKGAVIASELTSGNFTATDDGKY
ncbi:MAG: deoxyribose-phosphate aldolase [Bacillota bacterium]